MHKSVFGLTLTDELNTQESEAGKFSFGSKVEKNIYFFGTVGSIMQYFRFNLLY